MQNMSPLVDGLMHRLVFTSVPRLTFSTMTRARNVLLCDQGSRPDSLHLPDAAFPSSPSIRDLLACTDKQTDVWGQILSVVAFSGFPKQNGLQISEIQGSMSDDGLIVRGFARVCVPRAIVPAA